jgi:hypothetical protein
MIISQSIGCQGSYDWLTTDFVFNNQQSHSYIIFMTGKKAQFHLYYEGLLRYNVTSYSKYEYYMPPGEVRVRYLTSGDDFFFDNQITIKMATAPYSYPIVSDQTFNLQKDQQGTLSINALHFYTPLHPQIY